VVNGSDGFNPNQTGPGRDFASGSIRVGHTVSLVQDQTMNRVIA
jgi:hypothetical protein